MTYAYIPPAPFEKVQRYDFASCANYSFIGEWRSYRASTKLALLRKVQDHEEPKPFFREVIDNTISFYDLLDERFGLWILIKKYEVFGKFYQSYDHSGRRHHDSAEASLDCYIAFATTLIKQSDQEECYQYLSTLLKVMDALCALPISNVDSLQAKKISVLIDEEDRLISEIEGIIYHD